MNFIKWLLIQPKGKQFLAGCLITISSLASVIVWQEKRYTDLINQNKRELEIKEEAHHREIVDLYNRMIQSNTLIVKTLDTSIHLIDSVNKQKSLNIKLHKSL